MRGPCFQSGSADVYSASRLPASFLCSGRSRFARAEAVLSANRASRETICTLMPISPAMAPLPCRPIPPRQIDLPPGAVFRPDVTGDLNARTSIAGSAIASRRSGPPHDGQQARESLRPQTLPRRGKPCQANAPLWLRPRPQGVQQMECSRNMAYVAFLAEQAVMRIVLCVAGIAFR